MQSVYLELEELTVSKAVCLSLEDADVYHEVPEHTRRAAEDIAEGLRSEGVSACLPIAAEMSEWDLGGHAIIVVGSPCRAVAGAFYVPFHIRDAF